MKETPYSRREEENGGSIVSHSSFKIAAALLIVVLVVCCVIVLNGTEDSAADGSCGPNLEWTLEDDTLTISLIDPNGSGKMNDYTYSSPAPWKEKSAEIKTLVLGDGITNIGNHAFRDCTGFTGSLTIPDSVTSIGNYAFYNCSKFTGDLTIPSSVTSIGYNAFQNCSGFDGSLTISDSVTSISDHAFFNCSGFTGDLTIPSSVTRIYEYAFQNCSGFDGSLTIPSSVTSIGIYAFCDCTGFTGKLTIPSSVTSIGKYAFRNCSGFTGSLTISDSVTSISESAFSGCSGFTGDLTIPDSVTTIGIRAFQECKSLTSISFPDKSYGSSVSNVFVNLSFYLNETLIYNPTWDDVKGKVWTGDGDGNFNYKSMCTVTIVAGDGGSVSESSIDVSPGTEVEVTSLQLLHIGDQFIYATPVDIYHQFDRWVNVPESGQINDDVTITATFVEVYFVDIEITGEGYVDVKCAVAPYGTVIHIDGNKLIVGEETITAYHEQGYRFDRWENVPQKLTEDVTITAVFVQDSPSTHHVTVKADAHGTIYPTTDFYVADGTIISYEGDILHVGNESTRAMAHQEYKFDSWDGVPSSGKVTKDIIVTAKFTPISPQKHSVTYDLDGGSGTAPKQDPVAEGGSFIAAKYSGTKAGLSFGGWTYGGKTYQPGDKVVVGAEDVVMKAKWIYIVTFDVQGHGLEPLSIHVLPGEKVIEPKAPTEDGYTFDGWFKDKGFVNKWNFRTDTVTQSITLYAKWTSSITVFIITGTTVIDQGSDNSISIVVSPSSLSPTSVTWASSDENVVKVVSSSPNWKLSPKGFGTATITVTAVIQGNNYTDSITVAVAYVPEVVEEQKTAVIEGEDTLVNDINNGQTKPNVDIVLQTRTEIEISNDLVDAIRTKDDGSLSVKTPAGSMDLDKNALEAIPSEIGDRVVIAVEGTATPAGQNMRKAVDASMYVNDVLTPMQFLDTTILIGISYVPTDLDVMDTLKVYYIPDGGAPVEMPGAYYSNGRVYFETNHLSTYALSIEQLEVSHSVIYNVNGGTGPVPEQADVNEGDEFAVAAYFGTKDGYTFGGWTYGGQTYQQGDMIVMGTHDIVLKAKWIVIPTPTPTPAPSPSNPSSGVFELDANGSFLLMVIVVVISLAGLALVIRKVR